MINFLSAFSFPHALIGTVALLAFWFAAATRKGSRPHILAGRVHLIAMLGIVITAVPLAMAIYLKGGMVWSAFLGYLVVLVSHNSLVAWRAIRLKHDFQRFNNPIYRIGAVMTAVAGLAVMALGIQYGSVILIAFGGVGLITLRDAWSLSRVETPAGNWWLKQHLGGMIGNGIAVHIAFVQIGLGRFLRGFDTNAVIMLSWILPLVVGIGAGIWMSRKYISARPDRYAS